MKDFNWNKLNVLKELKELKLNKSASQNSPSGEMAKLQRNILMQAGLALLTIVLTVVILFAVTSAWYTNIIEAGGLTFRVETWSFEGKVEVSDVETYIAPGDEGVVSLTAQNDNEDTVEIIVSVAKTEMIEAMKKRLFFYVDTAVSRNGENMERVYLNSTEDYKYTVFGKGTLKLQEEVYNAPRIKWHWVYDVLGYYVLGTPTTDESGNITGLTIKDYLRPIEYDFDKATFVYNSETKTMDFLTVDGTTTPQEFLVTVFANDGYENPEGNQPEPVVIGEKVYYKVDVDENGEGVYAYLCSYSEIQDATNWDTETGEIAYDFSINPGLFEDGNKPRITHKATINVSAQKSEITAEEVEDSAALQNAINGLSEGEIGMFALSKDITLTETLTVPENAKVIIDLNGKTVTSGITKTGTEKTAVIDAAAGSSLAMTNGYIDAGNGTDYAVKSVGAEVVMNDVDITNSVYGIYVGDNAAGNTNDSSVYINDCNIVSSFVSVFVSGNGAASEQNTLVVIENSTLKSSDGYALSGNGSDGRWGTDIQVINSTLSSESYAAVYHPQRSSTLTVSEGSKLEGKTGIAIKAGFVTIIDSTVTGKGELVETEPTVPSKSGYNETNDAIYIETNYGHPIGLEIRGGTISSLNNYALQIFESDAENVTVKIYEGLFNSGKEKFVFDANWLAEGSDFEGNTNIGKTVNVKAQTGTETAN